MKKYLFLLLTILFMIQFSPSSVFGEGRVFEFESNTYAEYWHNNNPDYISFDSVRTNGSKERETLHHELFFQSDRVIKDASFIPLPDYITDLSQVDIEMIGELRAHIHDPLNSPRHDGVQIVNINGQRHLYIPIFTTPVLARESGLIYKIGSKPDLYRYDSNIKFRITFAAEPKLVIEPPERTIKTGETATYRAIMVQKNIDGTEKRFDVTNRAETTWGKEDKTGRATMIGKGRFRGEAIGDVDIKAKFTRDTGDVVAENAKLYIQDVPIGLTLGEYCDEQENLNVRAILQSQDELTKIEWTLRSGEAIIHSETSNNPSTSTQFIYPLENGQSYNLNVKVYYADGREETFTETFTYDVVCGEVDLFISQIDSPKTAKAGDRILTKINYGSLATTIHAKQTKIRLYLNNQLVGERSVSVPPGVNREIYIEWNVPNIKGNGTLRATINIPAEFTEITMSNNEKTMSMAIKEDESPSTPSNPPNTNFCAGNNNTSNVHFQIDECTVIPGDCTVDEEGNIDCDPPYCQFNTLYFSEYIDVKITNIKPKKLRAGAFLMPKQKLTIIPVTLHFEKNDVKLPISSASPSHSSISTMKTDQAEVCFHQGIDEQTIQIVMRELKNL